MSLHIICFIAFLYVFSTKKWLPKNTKKYGLLDPPPYLRLSPKKYQYFPMGALRDKIIKIRLDDMPDIECEMRSNVWRAKTLFTLGNIARRVESLLFTVLAKMR